MKASYIFLLFVFTFPILSAEELIALELKKGQNIILIEQYFPAVLVKDLVEFDKRIKSVNLKSIQGDLGYINIFGGIGTNFFFEPNKEYEIYVEEDLIMYLNNY